MSNFATTLGFGYSVAMQKDTVLQAVRRDFFYGLMVVLPIAITFWIVNSVIDIISWPIFLVFGYKIYRMASFFVSLTIIFFIGVITRHFVGRSVLSQLEKLVSRIPVISVIYKSSKQIISSFSFQNKNMEVVLLEYPRKGLWVLGYVSKKDVVGLVSKAGDDLGKGKYAVFVPTSPNPTTGYLVYVNADEVVPLQMGFEESMKLIVSVGAVSIGGNQDKK